METFYLTRKEMSSLLLTLHGKLDKTISAFIGTSMPPIFEKVIKLNPQNATFSLNDIVALGNQIKYTNFSIIHSKLGEKRY